MSPAEGGEDGDETGLENESATQTTLDDFTQPDIRQQSSLFEDEESSEELRDSIEAWDRSFGRPFFPESSLVRVVEELRQSTDLMVNGIVQDTQRVLDRSLHQTVRKIQRASISARMTGVMGTALASSVVGSTAVAGIDPSVFHTLGPQAMVGIEQMINEISTPPFAELGNAALWSAVRSMEPLSEVVEHQIQSTAEVAAQLGKMGSGTVTAGAVAASTAESRIGPAFERPELSWPPVELETADEIARTGWLRLRWIEQALLDVPPIVYTSGAGLVYVLLAYRYPEHRLAVRATLFLILLGIGLYSWRRNDR